MEPEEDELPPLPPSDDEADDPAPPAPPPLDEDAEPAEAEVGAGQAVTQESRVAPSSSARYRVRLLLFWPCSSSMILSNPMQC